MKYFIILLLTLYVFSCKKKNEEPLTSTTPVVNSKCLISSISETLDSLDPSSTICIYNSNNELIRLEDHNKQDQYSDSNFYNNYSYSNGRLSSITSNNLRVILAGEPRRKNDELVNIMEYTYQNNLLIEEKFIRQSNSTPKTFLGSRKYFYEDNKLKYSITDVDSIAYSQHVNERPGLVSYYLI